MKRLMRIPITLSNGNKFYPWNSLTTKEQNENILLTGILFQYCIDHPNKEITFEQMNRIGLSHLYRFFVDDYNSKNKDKKLTLTDTGLAYEFKIKRVIVEDIDIRRSK